MSFVEEYYEKIKAREIITSKRVEKVYKKLVAEIRKPKGDWIFDEKRAIKPINFIENFCRQSKGEWIGKNINLQLFQKAFIAALFGFVHKETGIRRFKEAFFLVARKNGKSTMLSGLILYMLVADGEGGSEIGRAHV